VPLDPHFSIVASPAARVKRQQDCREGGPPPVATTIVGKEAPRPPFQANPTTNGHAVRGRQTANGAARPPSRNGGGGCGTVGGGAPRGSRAPVTQAHRPHRPAADTSAARRWVPCNGMGHATTTGPARGSPLDIDAQTCLRCSCGVRSETNTSIGAPFRHSATADREGHLYWCAFSPFSSPLRHRLRNLFTDAEKDSARYALRQIRGPMAW